ncbi:MAG: ABC transporter permease [Candidatus Bipolaricaulota bacterium]
MLRYLAQRLLIAIPTLLGVSLLVFSMVRLLPGDPVDFIVAHSSHAVALDRDLIRHELGLDLPGPLQYFHFLGRILRGDLGTAIMFHQPVAQLIGRELPYTVRLTAFAMTLVTLFGFTLGITAALKPNSRLDSAVMATAVLGVSMPEFWVGMLFILAFSIKLKWFPILGPESLRILFLPALVLALRSAAIIARMLRSSLLEVMGEDYIRTARSKGLRERIVVMKHAMRNALLPVLTLMGLQLGGLLGGTVIIENVFARHGVGYLALNAILQRDYPLTQGIVLVMAVIFVVINLVVDIVYSYVNPRIRYG